jgi:hypothetical protein
VHTLLDGTQGYSEEQLPIWNEDLLSIKPKGLEDIHEIRPTIVRPKLDHRYLSPKEWLWWLQTQCHELP